MVYFAAAAERQHQAIIRMMTSLCTAAVWPCWSQSQAQLWQRVLLRHADDSFAVLR